MKKFALACCLMLSCSTAAYSYSDGGFTKQPLASGESDIHITVEKGEHFPPFICDIMTATPVSFEKDSLVGWDWTAIAAVGTGGPPYAQILLLNTNVYPSPKTVHITIHKSGAKVFCHYYGAPNQPR